jgi:hypothetical protein
MCERDRTLTQRDARGGHVLIIYKFGVTPSSIIAQLTALCQIVLCLWYLYFTICVGIAQSL